MERLTRRNSYGVSFMRPLDPDCGNYCDITHNERCGNHFNSITERLAAYEDTELTPEEISALKVACGGDMKANFAIEAIMCRKEAAAANLEKFKLKKERDTLKKALKLACKEVNKLSDDCIVDEVYHCDRKCVECLINHFIQQAQEQEGNHE